MTSSSVEDPVETDLPEADLPEADLPEADLPEAEESAAEAEPDADAEELFRQSEIAADYVEGLLDILDLDGDIDELVAGGRPVVEVVGGQLHALVGQRGATLEAMQELARLAVFRQTGVPSRLLLDIGGYRANRRNELAAVARNAIERVREHGQPVRLEVMSAFERKCVHDVINAVDGVVSESEGEEPNRRITVSPDAESGHLVPPFRVDDEPGLTPSSQSTRREPGRGDAGLGGSGAHHPLASRNPDAEPPDLAE